MRPAGWSANTERAYRADWRDFAGWCASQGLSPLPSRAGTVRRYVEVVGAQRRPSTVRRRLAAIAAMHRAAGLPSPAGDVGVRVAAALAERRQRGGGSPVRPLTVDELRRVVRARPATLAGARDRCLLLVGYGTALRCGELVALDVADVADTGDGLLVRAGARRVFVPYGSTPDLCSAAAWREWTAAARLAEGPLLRGVDRHGRLLPGGLGPHAVTRIVKRSAAGAGLDPARFSGQSLRRGMVAAAAARGVATGGVMAHTGLRSARHVRGYLAAGPA